MWTARWSVAHRWSRGVFRTSSKTTFNYERYMLWIIGFLTVVLVLDSLILVLLVLVQLPKKEAGIGQAFGAGATDALFGAGSGNALTKMTKYTTGIFFALTLLIYVLYNHQALARSRGFATQIQQASTDCEAAPSAKSATTPLRAGTPSK